jgi:hypothetical protein
MIVSWPLSGCNFSGFSLTAGFLAMMDYFVAMRAVHGPAAKTLLYGRISAAPVGRLRSDPAFN